MLRTSLSTVTVHASPSRILRYVVSEYMSTSEFLKPTFVDGEMGERRSRKWSDKDFRHSVTSNPPLAIFLSNPARKTLSIINLYRFIGCLITYAERVALFARWT